MLHVEVTKKFDKISYFNMFLEIIHEEKYYSTDSINFINFKQI